jgi:hypothetical protein
MFQINGEPLKLPPEFAVALAHVVIEWSRLEDAIASDLDWMMQFQVVADLAPEPPRMFNKKLDLWRRAINVLFVEVQPYRDLADLVVPRVKEVAKARNVLVHGAWPLIEFGPESFTVINTRYAGGGRVWLDTLEATRAGLEELTAEILDLAGKVTGLTMTRMLHGHYGLLTGSPARAPDHQAHPVPPIQEEP